MPWAAPRCRLKHLPAAVHRLLSVMSTTACPCCLQVMAAFRIQTVGERWLQVCSCLSAFCRHGRWLMVLETLCWSKMWQPAGSFYKGGMQPLVPSQCYCAAGSCT